PATPGASAMNPKPPREQDPVQQELEAALAGGSLLDLDLEHLRPAAQRPRRGERTSDLVTGVVVGIDRDDVFVELGPRKQGVIALDEFDEPPEVGASFEFTEHGVEDGLFRLSRRKARHVAAWNELAPGAHVEVVVKAANPGGLEVEAGPLAGFLPASHAADRHVDDLATLVGQRFVCEVIELDPDKRRLVVSRRNVLREQQREAREQLVGSLSVGDLVQGPVTRIEAFGAFVDLGGVEGLVHVSQLARRRVQHPDEVVARGQVVQAQVVKIEEGGKRIGLSVKALEPDPWDTVRERFAPDAIVRGRVVRMLDFGAFVELEPGLEGLLHVSQLKGGSERVRRPQDTLALEQQLDVRVVSVDPAQRRIALSRLDARGSLLGSDDSVETAEIDRVVEHGPGKALGTNLGALFKKALGDKG
ncbi:MAG TPA: S1 RNA-binding domain-containing protein, partial [Planctomycetota bacterium]|nr:S1 RNA-binding domain-containing protein [Planctomycetota bacterium]